MNIINLIGKQLISTINFHLVKSQLAKLDYSDNVYPYNSCCFLYFDRPWSHCTHNCGTIFKIFLLLHFYIFYYFIWCEFPYNQDVCLSNWWISWNYSYWSRGIPCRSFEVVYLFTCLDRINLINHAHLIHSWFRTLNWYLFLVGNWFFFGEGFVRRIDTALKSSFPDATTVHVRAQYTWFV